MYKGRPETNPLPVSTHRDLRDRSGHEAREDKGDTGIRVKVVKGLYVN